jgi:hypothetical protein
VFLISQKQSTTDMFHLSFTLPGTYYRLCSLSKTTGALVEQELLILPEHLSSFRVFSGVRVTRYLTLCVWFVDRCLSFCPFSFGHCVFCPSSIYGFWLPIWYLQTLLTPNTIKYRNPVLFVSLISQKQSTTEMFHFRKHFLVLSSFMTYYRFVTRVIFGFLCSVL